LSYLLDTNVVSELRRTRPNRSVLRWVGDVSTTSLFLSVLVVGEIRKGVERLRSRDAHQAAQLEDWLDGLRRDFGDRVLPVTTSVAEAWGRLVAPAPLPVVDSLLAATALVHGLTLVTRDVGPAERIGVPVLDPWR
jgi:toxin FitB